MIVQYLQNKNNGMLYRAIDNKHVKMWSKRKKDWIDCTTNIKDILATIDSYKLIDVKDIEKCKQ